MALLFILELQDFLSVHVTEQLYVDTTRLPNMKIHFDISFPRLGCDCESFQCQKLRFHQSILSKYLFPQLLMAVLSLDVIDSSGDQHFGVEHDIFKQRLDSMGNPVQAAQIESVNKIHNMTGTNSTELELTKPSTCLSCYGAKDGCCNTCSDVRDAYRQKNWAFRPEEFEQCRNERKMNRDESVLNEGCQIYGFLQVNRVSGSFHIAPGKSYAVNHVHGNPHPIPICSDCLLNCYWCKHSS